MKPKPMGVEEERKPIKISEELKSHLTRRQWARLWGQKSMIKPVFIEKALGDGNKLVAIIPLNTRPNYYLIRIDSSWSVRNTDEPCIADHIDEICEAIEDESGRKYETDDDDEEIVMPWPALDDEAGVSWCDSMDLLRGEDLMPHNSTTAEMDAVAEERVRMQ